ncbi:MAG: glycosyltransferase [Ignavibacteriales bacterium]
MIKKYPFIHMEDVLATTRLHKNQQTNINPKVASEGNTFWIKLVENFSDQQKIELCMGIDKYYETMIEFLSSTPYFEALTHCQNKLNEIYKNNNVIKILEINNIDILGRRFNGYDIQKYINNNTKHKCIQLVTDKISNDDNVKILLNNYEKQYEQYISTFESDKMSVHSNLSLTSPALKRNFLFNNSDIAHYHLIHNTKLSLYSLIELCNKKKSVFSIHDPWTITGRCVHFGECDKWKSGCKNCNHLKTLFPLNEDNCNQLWNLKKLVYDNINVDIVVSSEYMLNLIKTSPLTKNFKNVHLIPFGIDLDKFNEKMSSAIARKKFNIDESDIVIFHRAQKHFKGTEYILEAMKKLVTNKKITIITCDEVGLLNEIKNKFNIIDLGEIDTDTLISAYRACDFFLMPSIGESFGMMAIESMACGRPVIVFNNTSLPSITFAPECGVLVENKNSLALSNAILLLIENENERIKRGKLARKLAEKHYDVNIYNKKIVELYEEIYQRDDNFKDVSDFFTSKTNFNEKQSKLISDKLNNLTKTLYGNNKKNYDKLYINNNVVVDKGMKIEYDNLDVQKIIHTYNEKLYEIVKEDSTSYTKRGIIPIKQIKKFIYLYRNDRTTLKNIVSFKFKNHPKISRLINKLLK